MPQRRRRPAGGAAGARVRPRVENLRPGMEPGGGPEFHRRADALSTRLRALWTEADGHQQDSGGEVTSLFGRNPVLMAIVGIALLAGGLAMHARYLPWIGGFLLIFGGAKAVLQHKQGSGDRRYQR